MAGAAEPDRMGGRGKEFLRINYPMQDTHDFIAETIHDRNGDAEYVRIGLLIEVQVFDVQLAGASVVGAGPPGTIRMREAGNRGQGGK